MKDVHMFHMHFSILLVLYVTPSLHWYYILVFGDAKKRNEYTLIRHKHVEALDIFKVLTTKKTRSIGDHQYLTVYWTCLQ